jgi:anti-sigma regulatory factor (Ser/Thr protein kinase)
MTHLRQFGRADGDFDAAELVLGELLSNAGRYTPGPVCVSIDWADEFARASVCDCGTGFAWSPTLPPGFSERGRGLFIISAFARDIRVETDERGCCVSALLPIRRGADATAPPSCSCSCASSA